MSRPTENPTDCMMTQPRLRLLLLGVLTLGLGGCGAAYFGAAIGVIATQEKTSKVRTTAPDGALAAIEAPTLATLVIGATPTQDAQGRTGLPVQEVRFPDGYGESRSDRGAATSVTGGAQLVLSVNGDPAQTVTLDAASTGATVAAEIQAKVRLLNPSGAAPAAAYADFSCTFDAAVREYVLRSGVPGAASAVVVNPTGATPTAGSPAAQTAAALRLGASNNGVERRGAENVRWTVFNHGTDTLTAGSTVSMYLSRTKGVDPTSLLIRREALPRAVEVSRARRFTSANQAPPETLIAVQQSGEVLIRPGQYYLVLALEIAGDVVTGDNVAFMITPVQLCAPFGGMPAPNAPAPGTPADLDFAPVSFEAPIAAVTDATTVCNLTVTNLGAAVAAPTNLTVDVVLNTTDEFRPPTGVHDPDGTVAGLFVNPADVAQGGTLVLDPSGAGGSGIVLTVAGTTVTAVVEPTTTVNGLIQAVDASTAARAVVGLFWDRAGDPATATIAALFTAAQRAGAATLPTGGRILHRQTVVFPASALQQTRATYVLDVATPNEGRIAGLPLRFTSFVRITPPAGATPENDQNNVRRAPNYTRLYNQSTATFDNGVLLPTFRPSDFARLEPVTQRPVNTGSIQQGQQRVFRFEIPSTGLTLNESQLLVLVRTSFFDPHVELLDSTGRPVARSDDSALGRGALLYLPVAANANQLVFYLIVSNALLDDSDIGGAGASFDLTISVNPRQPGDPSLTQAVRVEQLFDARDEPTALAPAAGLVQNAKVIPFDLAQTKSEVMFVLPGRARVRFRTTPVFEVGVNAIITRFNEGEVPTGVQFQAEVDPASLEVVYRPSDGTIETSHLLRPGVYTMTFNSLDGPDARTLLLKLNVEFVPGSVN
ncbi:MAG: hypothetical protein M9894_29495 [Planctomycetes bacterium]|nr:hypothetical protein [Planctomycetota bacterium]